MPQNIYDNPEFFAGYSQLPRSREGLAGAPEMASVTEHASPARGDYGYLTWAVDLVRSPGGRKIGVRPV